MSNEHLKSQATSQTGDKRESRGPQRDTPTPPAKTGEIKKKKMNWNFQSCWWEGKMRPLLWKMAWDSLVKLNTASHTTQITRVFTHEK